MFWLRRIFLRFKLSKVIKSEHWTRMARFELSTTANPLLLWLRRLLDWCFANRRYIIVGLFLLLGLVYLFPNWFSFRSSSLPASASFWSLHNQLSAYRTPVNMFDAFIDHYPTPLEDEPNFAKFIGNGYFGLGLSENDERQIRVSNQHWLKISTHFQPLVKASLNEDYSSESKAFVTDVKNGIVKLFQVYRREADAMTIETTYYAHRTFKEALVQDITVRNPSDSAINVALARPAISSTSDSVAKKVTIGGRTLSVQLSFAKVPLSDLKDKYFFVGTLFPEVSSSISVQSRSTDSYRIISLISTTPTASDSDKTLLEDRLIQLYSQIASMESSELLFKHEKAWGQLWSSGFSISYSKAPGVLNGGIVNATMYYILSNSPSYEYDSSKTADEINAKLSSLYKPDRCYAFHSTLMYPSRLWSSLTTVQDIIDLTSRWKGTLKKRGCLNLLSSGAEGVLQAMILSFGAFKFTHSHLELDARPQELHRDYFFRRLVYDNSSFLNISVTVGSDNKPALYVSVNQTLDSAGKKFYACDAGCLDTPISLSSERVFLPVKLTDPPTPLLYISNDFQQMKELHDSIHVKEVIEAPAHEQHVIALHKHGHRLGGLPTLFWVVLAFLLITFHLFLFNLIYNELCRDEKQSASGRSRYAV